MAFVTVESFVGILCPLTILENVLRGDISDQTLSKYLSKIIYYNFPSSFFLALYFTGFLVAIYLSFKYPPKK